jgi:membrane protein
MLWDEDTTAMPRWRAEIVALFRVFVGVARTLAEGQLSLRAMSLVYTTLLSLVPLLAISFSVLKGFGVHNQIEPLMLSVLKPLGDKGVEITTRIIEFVENVKAGVLGSMGLGLLIYTVISLMQKIERAFNYTWHVTQNRSFAQRFSDYISVIVVGPVLVFSALGITASATATSLMDRLAEIEPLGSLIGLAGALVPYLLIVAAFTFIYVFMPNTKVRIRSALVGALVAGTVWETAGWAFASFIVGSTKYAAIYSAFATLVLFMIWLYFSWLILLVGASVAFYHQNPEYAVSGRRGTESSIRAKEMLALAMAALVCRRYYDGGAGWTLDDLVRRVNLPPEGVDAVLALMCGGGFLKRSDDEPAQFLPARPPDTTEVAELLRCVRGASDGNGDGGARAAPAPGVDGLMAHLDEAAQAALNGRTLKELALNPPEAWGAGDGRRPAPGAN